MNNSLFLLEMAADLTTNVIRRKMVRFPDLQPKTKFGQRTVRSTNGRSTQYSRLRSSYYESPSKLASFLAFLRERVVSDSIVEGEHHTENGGLARAEEGVYSWILKNKRLYASRLITNQEMGTLHADLNTLTLEEEDMGEQGIDLVDLTNRRRAERKPVAAGELLLVRSGEEQGGVRVYFNLQSGTYSEKLLRQCGLRRMGRSGRGVRVPKEVYRACLEEMVGNTRAEMAHLTGIPEGRIQFLSCAGDAQDPDPLEEVPFLRGMYEGGPCRDDDEYAESQAGRSLLRRYRAVTSPEHMEQLNRYFVSSEAVGSDPTLLGTRKQPDRDNSKPNRDNSNQSSRQRRGGAAHRGGQTRRRGGGSKRGARISLRRV
jgi:hypothetical protein